MFFHIHIVNYQEKTPPSKHNYSLNPAPKKEQRFDREHNKIVT